MVHYKQSFWRVDVGTGDVGANKRAQIAKAAYMINNHPDVLLSISCGGRANDTVPEISIITLPSFDLSAFHSVLVQALANESLSVGVRLAENTQDHDFGQFELDNITEAVKVESREKACKTIDELAALCVDEEQPTTAKPAETRVPRNFPAREQTEPFSVTFAQYRRLLTARGNDIQTIVINTNNALASLQTQTNTASMTAMMVASGFFTVGRAMWTAYSRISETEEGISTIVSGLINAIGFNVVTAGVLAVATAFGIFFVANLDEKNILLVMNNSNFAYTLAVDAVQAGIRGTATIDLPSPREAGNTSDAAYPCSVYVYHKRFSTDTGGSRFGIVLRSTQAAFGIGMSCPVMSRNGMFLVPHIQGQDLARTAASAASASASTVSASMSINITSGSCLINRSGDWGHENYAVCDVSTSALSRPRILTEDKTSSS